MEAKRPIIGSHGAPWPVVLPGAVHSDGQLAVKIAGGNEACEPSAALRPPERPIFSAGTCISSNASQYFFLCGELLKERQMALRIRSISASSMSSITPH